MEWAIPLAAVRVLLRRQAPGTVEALLAYLPYALDEETQEEIWYGLEALTKRDGKASPTWLLVWKINCRRAGRLQPAFWDGMGVPSNARPCASC
jgi:hypothetical protein